MPQSLVPHGTTGKTCLKLPPSSTTCPRKGKLPSSTDTFFTMSLSDLSVTSNRCLCDMGASSHVMSWPLIAAALLAHPMATCTSKEAHIMKDMRAHCNRRLISNMMSHHYGSTGKFCERKVRVSADQQSSQVAYGAQMSCLAHSQRKRGYADYQNGSIPIP